MVYNFFSWFIAFMLWLPTAIGGWLVYFGLISTSTMWLMSLVISAVLAVYITQRKSCFVTSD